VVETEGEEKINKKHNQNGKGNCRQQRKTYSCEGGKTKKKKKALPLPAGTKNEREGKRRVSINLCQQQGDRDWKHLGGNERGDGDKTALPPPNQNKVVLIRKRGAQAGRKKAKERQKGETERKGKPVLKKVQVERRILQYTFPSSGLGGWKKRDGTESKHCETGTRRNSYIHRRGLGNQSISILSSKFSSR